MYWQRRTFWSKDDTTPGTVTSFSFTNANGITGVVTNPSSTPDLTLSLGAITPTSVAVAGTGGNGFLSILSQSSTPTAPASGYVEYADSTGRQCWRRASDGFTRTWDSTLTANRVFSLPDATTTIAGLAVAQSFTQLQTFSLGASIASGQTLNWNNDLFLYRNAAAALKLGGADAATSVAQFLTVQGIIPGTSNTSGSTFTIQGSPSTGTGVGGRINLQLTPAGGSGTSQNAFVTALSLQCSGAGTLIQFGATTAVTAFPFSGTATTTATAAGTGLGFFSPQTSTTDEYSFAFNGNGKTATSGTTRDVGLLRTFNPTSGTAVYNMLSLTPTINQTGGANGVTRGIFISPTLTAASDFRALEIVAGNLVMPSGTTGMTTGFPYMPSAAGAPSGTPTSVTGNVPYYYDTTNNKFYVYNGAWKSVTLA